MDPILESPVARISYAQRDRARRGEPLLVHVGGARDARAADLSYGLGTLIWRGSTGVEAIAELRADPLSGAYAYLDLAGYESANRERPDLALGGRLRDSRLDVLFTPGKFADPKAPGTVAHFLEEVSPAVHAQFAARGVEALMIPVVALRTDWLTKPALLEAATSAIAAHRGPVGVVLASVNNPLGATAQVRGWVELLRATENVLALRTDEAAIGALANGAISASVGTSSAARHLYVGRPPKDRTRRTGFDVLHPQTLSWLRTERLDGFAVNVEDMLCACKVCGGRSLRRFTEHSQKAEGIAHSIAVLQRLAVQVATSDHPAEAWMTICSSASDCADRMNRVVEGYNLGRSARAWVSALQLTG
jgi:hypothetical protein